MALLATWGRRFSDPQPKDWKKVISFKYNTVSPNIFWAKAENGSSFWESVTWALNASKNFYKWIVGNGENIKFWHDIWSGDSSLKVQFWDLYSICNQPECTISQVWDGIPPSGC
ncbi:hypothetical protein ZWY2020_006670 [Hordeum vulgare]|nr:hypothetical protein ZWY2020_006670 [Hordeum vulgare]